MAKLSHTILIYFMPIKLILFKLDHIRIHCLKPKLLINGIRLLRNSKDNQKKRLFMSFKDISIRNNGNSLNSTYDMIFIF